MTIVLHKFNEHLILWVWYTEDSLIANVHQYLSQIVIMLLTWDKSIAKAS